MIVGCIMDCWILPTAEMTPIRLAEDSECPIIDFVELMGIR